ncbi:hypothetical protein TESG_03312 [Trichophyton tonsurans CBS 112818]|uniref:Oxidase ustYa n=2 Tax=Trichophyton TaxID=5550 RepID=F2Q0P0_TRIEC|nr:hypothetical protein TESG_03312 [Trichophyton tonsurans CBS 112818]EGE07708.1 hypothetical protein TEQG_06691 [Trichophyton equinum CBS 127.97]
MITAEKKKGREYERLVSEDAEDIYPELIQSQRRWGARRVMEIAVYTAVISVVALALGLFIGISWPSSRYIGQDGYLVPSGTVQGPWHRNHTFTQIPTKESEEAWNSLMPMGRGFVHHPELAPYTSLVAVFHELHCLHTIWIAYHILLDRNQAAKEGRPPDPFLGQTTLVSPSHMGHCADYLRQAIMCAADTNLEQIDKNGNSDGWNMIRTCRDFDGVHSWSSSWANTTERGVID